MMKDPVLPLGKPTAGSAGETGTWRDKRPVIDLELCNKCYQCWLACPEVSITKTDDGPKIDYRYCKGCGICHHECPKDAITIEKE